MSKFFRGPGAKRHFILTLIPLCIIFVMWILGIALKDNELPEGGNEITAVKPTTFYSVFKRDSVAHRIKKGDKIKILGYDFGSSSRPYSLWIETDAGYRGMIEGDKLGLPMIAKDEDTNQIDTVKIISQKYGEYVCRYADGSEKEVDFEDVMPVLPNDINLKALTGSSKSNYYMTPEKFEREYIGKSLAENETKYRPAFEIAMFKDSLRVEYLIKIIDTETGERYNPIVTYDKSLNAVSFAPSYIDDRSDWLISILPFFGSIIDNGFFASMIEGSLYEAYLEEGLIVPWWKFCFAVIALVFMLFWFFFTPFMPALLMACLMHFPKVFYPLGNKTLRYVIFGVMLICFYIWLVLMLAWGMFWIFAVLSIIAFLVSIGYIIGPLSEDSPCFRCLGCRSLGTMSFSHSKFEKEYQKWMREMEYVKTVDQQVDRWKTWTDVTTTYSDGHKERRRTNEQNHKRVTTTKLYDDYKVLYNVKVYKNTFKCCCCGQEEYTYPEKYKEIDREYLGAHTETTTRES